MLQSELNSRTKSEERHLIKCYKYYFTRSAHRLTRRKKKHKKNNKKKQKMEIKALERHKSFC